MRHRIHTPVMCRAHVKATGKPCGNWAIPGGTVCRYHGGNTKAARRKAAERIADLIDPDRTLREMARIAFSDPRQLFDEAGHLRPVKDWPDELAATISSFETVKRNVDSSDGKVDDVVKVKLWDKVKTLEMLAKHLGLLQEKVTHDGELVVRWQGDEA